ncbi:MAG TPA: RNA 2',3'-cyclic phosphodiesterase [Pyrinomonadaceae bacterium]|nr:RNA 2',3'-cyclic phosphodiesterase [Pyrinomonadaceae bacterium]
MTTGDKTHWRLFFAVELPRDLKARVGEHLKRLRESFPHVRASWEKPEKIHITLKFIGEVEASRVEELARAAERAAATVEPFELTINAPGAFPPHGPPRVLWLGVEDPSARLSKLQRALEDEASRAGFPREQRPFKPHLTLARIRAPQGARELAAAHRETPFGPQSFDVSELVLMRSELGPGGSRYDAVSCSPLSGGAT